MKKKNQHVVPHEDGWAIKGEGNKRATKVTETKAKAVKVARELAKKNRSELIIHNRDGTISDKDSYGKDPCPPKDKKH